MLTLKDDNGIELPQEVQDRVNAFIDNLPKVTWFKPSEELKKEEVEKQVKFTLECFGINAGIEYRSLETEKDWNSAWDSAWASARDSAWNSAWASARGSAWDSTRASARVSAMDSARASAWNSAWNSARASAMDSAWASAWNSAMDSAWASQEVLLEDNEEFKKEYPNWAFIQLFKLLEMGLYPAGILKETKTFVIYIPPCSIEFPDKFK